jgi:import inner membrane translocase subunit TIM16
VGRFIHRPMSREEACKILAVEEAPELNHKEILDRFEALFEKNLPEKGGSFYLQSKIYFAKEQLMKDFPPDLNKSKFNPTEDGADNTNAEESKENAENTKEQK